ncbi:MAG: hypothetical protein ABI377_10140, partial [Devosia sp.]
MKLKIALISATALGMLMATGAVYAGDANNLGIWEQGNNNTAATDQTNAHNSSIGDYNNPAGQIGDDNNLSITQRGGYNRAGLNGYGSGQGI